MSPETNNGKTQIPPSSKPETPTPTNLWELPKIGESYVPDPELTGGDSVLAKLRQTALDKLGVLQTKLGDAHENGFINAETKEKISNTVKALGGTAINFTRAFYDGLAKEAAKEAGSSRDGKSDLPSVETIAVRTIRHMLAESAKPRLNPHKRFDKKAEKEADPARPIREVAQTGVPKQHNRSKSGKNSIITAFRHTKVEGKANRKATIEQNTNEKREETAVELELLIGSAAWDRLSESARDTLIRQHWEHIGFDTKDKTSDEIDAKRQETKEDYQTLLGADAWSKLSEGEKTSLIKQSWKNEGYNPKKEGNVPTRREVRKWARGKRDFRHTAFARYADISYLKHNRLTGSIDEAKEDYVAERVRELHNNYLDGEIPERKGEREFHGRAEHPLKGPGFTLEDKSKLVEQPDFASRRRNDLINKIRETLPTESRLHRLGSKLKIVGSHEDRVQRHIDEHLEDAERIARERLLDHSTIPNPSQMGEQVTRAQMEEVDLRLGEGLHRKLMQLRQEEQARLIENERLKSIDQAPITPIAAETFKAKAEAAERVVRRLQRQNKERYERTRPKTG